MDLTEALTKGENVLGATVLYFGQGDTTCPMSRAGFIFRLELEFTDGRKELVVSDNSWRCHLSQAWKPGQLGTRPKTLPPFSGKRPGARSSWGGVHGKACPSSP